MGTTHWLQRPQTCWKFDKEASRNITVTPPQTNQKKVYSLQPSPQTSPLKNHLLEFPSGLAVGTAKKKKKKKKKKEKKNQTKQNQSHKGKLSPDAMSGEVGLLSMNCWFSLLGTLQ